MRKYIDPDSHIIIYLIEMYKTWWMFYKLPGEGQVPVAKMSFATEQEGVDYLKMLGMKELLT